MMELSQAIDKAIEVLEKEIKKHPYSKPARTFNRVIYGMNHKGDWCPFGNTTCQEGVCPECAIWQRPSSRLIP